MSTEEIRQIFATIVESGEIEVYIGIGEQIEPGGFDLRGADQTRDLEVVPDAKISIPFDNFGPWLMKMHAWWLAERDERERADPWPKGRTI